MRTQWLVAVAWLTMACASSVDPATVSEPADRVFLSGAVYTVDPQRPWAAAVAVRDGRITAVGTSSEVRRYVGDDTRVVDLEGRMLLPRFHDAHIVRMDENAHAVWVNSKALALGGVDRNTPDPPAGVIERDPQTGEATGTLRESAVALVRDHVPEADAAQVLRGARWAIERLHSAGITSVVDAAMGEQQLTACAALADLGELDLRVVACIEVGLLRRDSTGAIAAALNERESVELATLIEAYTANGGFVMHQEEETGTIAVGKAADLVVLERNLFEVPPEEIGEVRILETLVVGRTVFSLP